MPTCAPCSRRHVQCTYASDPSRTRFGALKNECDELLANHNNLMELYGRLKYADRSELSRLVEEIRSTDRVIDMASFDYAYGRPSEAFYDMSDGTTAAREQRGRQAATGHASEQTPSHLVNRMPRTAQTNSIDIPIDPALCTHSSRLPYGFKSSSLDPTTSHYVRSELADTDLVAPAQNHGIYKAVRQYLHTEAPPSNIS